MIGLFEKIGFQSDGQIVHKLFFFLIVEILPEIGGFLNVIVDLVGKLIRKMAIIC